MSGIVHVLGCKCGAARCHNAAIEAERAALESQKRCETPGHTTMILDGVPARCGTCGYLYEGDRERFIARVVHVRAGGECSIRLFDNLGEELGEVE